MPDATPSVPRGLRAGEATPSRLGLGAWAFGRTGWGAQDDRDSRAAIVRALEHGVNWIDTAAVYGDGHSERLVGRALAQLPHEERPMVFTKGGIRIDRTTGATYRDLSPANLRSECEQSLRRLGVERIDLYQLHWPVDDLPSVRSAWETLARLKDEGKVRWIGVSNFDIDLLELSAELATVDGVQVPLSLINRDAGMRILPWVAENGALGLVYSPLESGLLSGGFSRRRLATLPDGDRRPTRPQFEGTRLDEALELVRRLRPIAAGAGASIPQLAIAWVLSWPGVGGAIVGARNAEQVSGWAGAASLRLDADALRAIESVLLETGAGAGPTSPPDLDRRTSTRRPDRG